MTVSIGYKYLAKWGCKVKEHTYQLNVELQVHSARSNPKDVETRWHSLLSQLIELGDDCATVSAIKCAETHKFDEAQFTRSNAKWVNEAFDVIALLIEDGADGGFGEFDNSAGVLVKSRWPNVTEWECGQVTYSEGVVTLHDLYVVE